MLHYEDIPVGWTETAGGYSLTEDEIVEFARRWDPQPWHVDREAAQRSPMKGITASSAHTYAIAASLLNRIGPIAGIASLRHEIDLPAPARPGDVLTLSIRCVEKRPSATRLDRGLLTLDMSLVNQAGECVMQMRSLMMLKTRAAGAQSA
jgi:acyl dehydratase